MSGNGIRHGSLFSGSGGFDLAARMAGMETAWQSEIEPFPLRVLRKNFPEARQLGDVRAVSGAEAEPVDVVSGGSPCFPAGTLVLTDGGYAPIELVREGARVLTHEGRWRRVTSAGCRWARTVVLRGNHYGLECTPEHPVYAACAARDGAGRMRLEEDRSWVPAERMRGWMWAVPNSVEPLPIPEPRYEDSRQKPMPELGEGLFYFVGRWLGDGWLRDGQRGDRPRGQEYGQVIVCDDSSKEDELHAAVSAVADRYCVERRDGVSRFRFCNLAFCGWLRDNFGKYSHGKRLPAWVYGMREEWRAALLRGVCDSDGYRASDSLWKVGTVSKELAEGLRLLGEIQGYSTTVLFRRMPRRKVIKGRVVNQRDCYTVELRTRTRREHLKDGLHGWYRVRSVLPPRDSTPQKVYNLSVEGDESYVADGIVVHNCQDMSSAGKREGLEGRRSSLFHEQTRICREMREATNGRFPRYMAWENVAGALESGGGEISGESSGKSRGSRSREFEFLDLRAGSGAAREPSWETATRLPGEPWTPDTGESPRGARESTLSRILEESPPQRYCLPPAACARILGWLEAKGPARSRRLADALRAQMEAGARDS